MKSTEFKFGPIKLPCKFVSHTEFEELFEEDENMGEFDPYNGIKIDSDLPVTSQYDVLVHEIIEAINWQYALELEHPLLSTIGCALSLFFIENPQFFDYVSQSRIALNKSTISKVSKTKKKKTVKASSSNSNTEE